MSDEVDIANDHIEQEFALRLAAQRSKPIAVGHPGDCELCGEWSGRLVGGACAPCRDKYHLP